MNWQPIETAPDDGKPILCCFKDWFFFVCSARGGDTAAPGYAAPEWWTPVEPPLTAGLVLAFSGALGTGKSGLTRALSEKLHWRRVSFGDQVRKVAQEAGQNSNDRAVLQQLGQALVLTNREQFVQDVLNQNAPEQGPNPAEENLIVDGVRHIEVLLEIRLKMQPRVVKLIYIKTDTEMRQVRLMQRDHIDRRIAARYESDITEAQIGRILPQYADLTIDGSLPTSILVQQVQNFVERSTLLALPTGFSPNGRFPS